MSSKKQTLSKERTAELIQILSKRFAVNMDRHKGVKWDDVEKKLIAQPAKLWSLNEMEETEGEPDVIAFDKKENLYTFCDCSTESPKGRRSLCYDHEALAARKEHKPKNSAVEMAKEIGIALLNEEQYIALQKLGKFDLKTSSWLQTPKEERALGGAIFGDRRYNRVFVYHNGAESYYGARGFRGILVV